MMENLSTLFSIQENLSAILGNWEDRYLKISQTTVENLSVILVIWKDSYLKSSPTVVKN